ncbi:MAG: hypothetical protein R3C32_10385 [Chloroflexota bacterium]
MTITDIPSSMAVTKTADPDTVPEPSGDVTFSVVIENTSPADAITIDSLVDDVYGDLDGRGTCAVPQGIGPGEDYACSFTGTVAGNAGRP